MQPEKLFQHRLHRRFPGVAPHHEKTHNVYRGGTADVWYSGMLGDLWVEYKIIGKRPARSVKLTLTPLQRHWIESRRAEGRRVWVIVGIKTEPNVGIVLKEEIPDSLSRSFVDSSCITLDKIARLILETTGRGYSA